MIRRVEWAALAAIVLVYLVLAGQYAARTPRWQAPDEPAHYNYIRQIADDRRLPVLRLGDWQQDYQDSLTGSGFDPALLDRLDTVQYEDHQPPLYYLLQAPVFAATDGDLRALRWVSVLLGVGVVLCAWAVIRLLVPRWPAAALTGAGFVAFVPQHLSILGSVSNDALAELIAGLVLAAAVGYVGNRVGPADPAPTRRPGSELLLGLLAGLALITKTTIYFVAGVAVLAVLLRGRRERWDRQAWTVRLAAVIAPMVVLGALWWGRNVAIYGGTDFAGLQRHDEVTIGQVRTDFYIDVVLGGNRTRYVEHYAATTFHSFWGQFGWMAVPMPLNVYRVFGLLALIVLAGAVGFAVIERWPRALSGPQRDGLILLGLALVFVVAAYLLYNRSFVQFQGRYLFPALIPLGLLVGLGLTGWCLPLARRFPAAAWLPLVIVPLLAAFAWAALDRYLVPNLPVW